LIYPVEREVCLIILVNFLLETTETTETLKR
jgi:hypothetical protein